MLLHVLEVLFPHAPGVSFAAWMGYAVPLAVLFAAVMYGFMVWRRCPSNVPVSIDALRAEYDTLGPMSLAEVLILLDLIALVFVWLLRSFSVFPDTIGDGTLAMTTSLLLFVLPAHRPHLPWHVTHAHSASGHGTTDDAASPHHHSHKPRVLRRVLDWNDSKNIGWGVLIILGGGFGLAAGMKKSGLTSAIALLLSGLRGFHPFLIVLLIVTAVTFMTELMSNVAVANLLLPVLAATAVAAGQNPLLFMTPATIAASFAFMLPVRVPPVFCCY